MGFSVNAPVSESQFIPLEEGDLDRLIGPKKYHLADNPERLDENIKIGRIGRELFPWMMLLIVLVVSIEGVLANRFYREAGPQAGQGAAARQAA
jgi:hypothetical protein